MTRIRVIMPRRGYRNPVTRSADYELLRPTDGFAANLPGSRTSSVRPTTRPSGPGTPTKSPPAEAGGHRVAGLPGHHALRVRTVGILRRRAAWFAGWFSRPVSPGFLPGLLGTATGSIPSATVLQTWIGPGFLQRHSAPTSSVARGHPSHESRAVGASAGRMPERRGHAVSKAQDGRSERPATWRGDPDQTLVETWPQSRDPGRRRNGTSPEPPASGILPP